MEGGNVGEGETWEWVTPGKGETWEGVKHGNGWG